MRRARTLDDDIKICLGEMTHTSGEDEWDHMT